MEQDVVFEITEIFTSIQGEGEFVGYPCLFVRFAGCNLKCSFCDTDFSKKEEYTLSELIKTINYYVEEQNYKFVVLTGGEPTLQPIDKLLAHFNLKTVDFIVETNGYDINKCFDATWVCLSPKDYTTMYNEDIFPVVSEYKFIVPDILPEFCQEYKDLISEYVDTFINTTGPVVSLQPEFLGNNPKKESLRLALEMIHERPDTYRLSLQTHKFIGVE